MNPLFHLRWRLGAARERILNCLVAGRMDVVPASWPLSPDVCPCDVHLCEYLQARDIRRSAIFHFGSGGHHLLGLRNRSDGLDNEILAITASPSEHARYVSWAVRDVAVARHYRVLFGDIYDLGPATLATFDLATLFHLCEYPPKPGARRRLDDAGVLALLMSKVRVGGRLLFYGGSFAFAKAEALRERAIKDGQLTLEERYKSLLIYRV